jgi:hypothetical protein
MLCRLQLDELPKTPPMKRRPPRSGARFGLMRQGAAIGLILSVWQILSASAVSARAPAPGLSWVRGLGAESCINSVELAKRVEVILGRAVFVSASEAELVIEGYVNPKKGGGFEARLMVIDGSGRWLGSRDLSIELLDCSALDDALALVIAVTINPQSGLAGESILSPEMAATLDGLFSKDAAEVAAAEQLALAEEASGASQRSRPKILMEPPDKAKIAPNPYFSSKNVESLTTFFLSASVGVGVGLQPGIASSLAAEAGFETDKIVRLGLRGAFSFDTDAKADDDRTKRAGFQTYSITPLVCPFSMSRGPHSISGCAGLMLGAITVKPKGFEVKNRNASVFIVNPTFEFRLKWKFDEHISPGLGMSAYLPLLQHSFSYRAEAGQKVELSRMDQIAVGANLSLEFRY